MEPGRRGSQKSYGRKNWNYLCLLPDVPSSFRSLWTEPEAWSINPRKRAQTIFLQQGPNKYSKSVALSLFTLTINEHTTANVCLYLRFLLLKIIYIMINCTFHINFYAFTCKNITSLKSQNI